MNIGYGIQTVNKDKGFRRDTSVLADWSVHKGSNIQTSECRSITIVYFFFLVINSILFMNKGSQLISYYRLQTKHYEIILYLSISHTFQITHAAQKYEIKIM